MPGGDGLYPCFPGPVPATWAEKINGDRAAGKALRSTSDDFFDTRKNLAEAGFKARSSRGQFAARSLERRENSADNGLSGRARARSAASALASARSPERNAASIRVRS